MLKFIKSTLVIFLGFVFIFSAFAKMVPLEFFEFQIAEMINSSWRSVEVIARLVICVEFALGVLLILHIQLRKFTLPAVALLLTLFTILLIYQLIVHGNQPNCGCFGDQVVMSTSAGIAKNIFLLVVVIIVYFLAPAWQIDLGKYKWALPIIFLLLMLIPYFMMKPIEWKKVTDRPKLNNVINYDPLYDSTLTRVHPSFDYKKGKHIFIFGDLSCGHCKLAVTKASIIKQKNPDVPFMVVMIGDSSLLEDFRKATYIDQLEWMHFPDVQKVIGMIGRGAFPDISWINNGIQEYDIIHYEMNQEDIETWLNTTNKNGRN